MEFCSEGGYSFINSASTWASTKVKWVKRSRKGGRKGLDGWGEAGLQVWRALSRKVSLREWQWLRGGTVCPSGRSASGSGNGQVQRLKAVCMAGGGWTWEKAEEVQVGKGEAGCAGRRFSVVTVGHSSCSFLRCDGSIVVMLGKKESTFWAT